MLECNSKSAELAIDIGEELLLSGAEIHRVEDTISRICKSCGMQRAEVFCIIKAIVVTVKFDDGTTYTSSRRILATNKNYKRIAKLNALSRRICAGELSESEVASSLAEIKCGYECPMYKTVLGYILLAFSFCIFFGGNLLDAAMTIPCALFMSAYSKIFKKLGVNNTVYNFIACFLSGVIIMLIRTAGVDINIGRVLTGALMLLIPGIRLSTSIEDLLMGDTTSGLLNICESILASIAIAAGYALALRAFGVSDITESITDHSWMILLFMSLISSFAYSAIVNVSTSLYVFNAIGGALIYFFYHFAFVYSGSEFGSVFIAASIATLYSRICAWLLKAPTPIFSIPAMIPLAPGNSLYLTIHNALQSNWDEMQYYFLQTLMTSFGIALGLMGVIFTWNIVHDIVANAKDKKQGDIG